MADSIRRANTRRDLDVLIIGRGGTIEDLGHLTKKLLSVPFLNLKFQSFQV